MMDKVTALHMVCGFLLYYIARSLTACAHAGIFLPEKEGVNEDDEQLSGRTKEN
jgi:hypothetical protein